MSDTIFLRCGKNECKKTKQTITKIDDSFQNWNQNEVSEALALGTEYKVTLKSSVTKIK